NFIFFPITEHHYYKTLYSFKGGTDGAGPVGGVILDPSLRIYGVTTAGGIFAPLTYGTVYKVTPGGGTETILYRFTNGADGGTPAGGLVRDSSGNLYGTTYSGGANGLGVIFEITR